MEHIKYIFSEWDVDDMVVAVGAVLLVIVGVFVR